MGGEGPADPLKVLGRIGKLLKVTPRTGETGPPAIAWSPLQAPPDSSGGDPPLDTGIPNQPAAPAVERLSWFEAFLRLFTEIRPGEGATCLILLVNIFLVLGAYYLIKPVREGWLAVSVIQGLSKLEVKAYTSFGQSLVLVLVLPLYARMAGRLTRIRLITTSTLFFISNLFVFWVLRPGFLASRIPYVGVAFYVWVGIFSVAVVAQFWAFAADLYTDERGKRLFPLIAVGASAGAVVGSWFTEHLVRSQVLDTYHLIPLAAVPLAIALGLTWFAERRGVDGDGRVAAVVPVRSAATDTTRALELLLKNRYVLAAALLGLLINWVNTNGENILYGAVQQAVEHQTLEAGLTDPAAISRFVKDTTTAFYGSLYFWVNLIGLLLQAFVVSRLLRVGGFAAVILLTPLIALVSYSCMALFPVLLVIRWMKVAENSTNYSVNNTAKHVLWLPTPPAVTYTGKALADTLFVRTGDALAALTILAGTRLLGLSLANYIALNIALVLAWGGVAAFLARENRRLVSHLERSA